MAISDLERSISALERSLDGWGWWMTVATSAVVLGLIIEYLHQVVEFVKKPARTLFRELLGAILITGGVAGELFVQAKASRVEGTLREANHATFIAQASQIRDANGRILQDSKRVIELETLLANRRLSADQQRAIGTSLAKYHGKVLVWLRSSPGDNEAKRIGREIGSALKLAGIEVEDRLGFNAESFVGIRVDCPPTRDPVLREFAAALVEALTTHGKLEVSPFSEFGCRGAENEVFVGQKPLPDIATAK